MSNSLKHVTDFVEDLGYTEPNIVEYHKNKVDIFIRDKSYIIQNIEDYPNRSVKYVQGEAELYVNGKRWFRQYLPASTSVGGVFSHYWFARGHTLTTGLGLGIRENWLLNKKEVTKLTIIEKSLGLIEYHREHNPQIFEKAEVIHADANEYVGECDVLLMDHYEQESIEQMAKMSSKVAKNINCEVCWFWPLEELIQLGLERIFTKQEKEFLDKWQFLDNYSDWDATHQNKFSFTLLDSYEYIKKKFDLPKLPEVDQQMLNILTLIFNIAPA